MQTVSITGHCVVGVWQVDMSHVKPLIVFWVSMCHQGEDNIDRFVKLKGVITCASIASFCRETRLTTNQEV
jgi:hypothetical protein